MQTESTIDLIGITSISVEIPSPMTFVEAVQFLLQAILMKLKSNLKISAILLPIISRIFLDIISLKYQINL
jgi:hypothetical protein